MIDRGERETISRRKALSLLGLASALGLAAPAILVAVSEAEAQVDKPIPGEENVTPRRSPRRQRARERRQARRKHHVTPRAQPPQQQPQPDTEYKPKPY
jgi:hypothetical protein